VEGFPQGGGFGNFSRRYGTAAGKRLLEIKRRYDPQNIFRVHHGVGSEAPG
jgi:FAD/FMN-containing dehydrogenase